jgi:multiple sugar transport system substrate-binding protein
MRRRSLRLAGIFVLLFACLLLYSPQSPAQQFDWQIYKGATIRVIQNKGSVGLGIEALLPEFEKLTGIKVQYETYTEDQYRQKVLLELGAGSGGLDAFATYAAQEGLKFWRSGWYEPLDPYLKNPRMTDPGFDLADISKVAVQGNIYDGKLTSLPVQQNTTMLFYRKDLFEKLKLKVPQTYAELEETAKKLHNTEEGGQKVVGIVMRGKMAAATSQWAPYLLGMGGTWLGKDGKPAVNSPEAVQAFDLYGRLLRNYGPPGAVNYHWYECVSLFVQGKAAMYTDVNSRLFQLEDPAKSQVVGKIGYALFPAGPAGRKPTMEAISMAVSSKSKKKEAAYLFLQWAAGKDVALKLLVKGVPVPRVSPWKDPRFLNEQKHKDWVEASLKSLEISSTEWNPPVIAVSEVRDVVGAAIVSSILGENVKAAADKAAVEMAKIMEKTEGK